MSRPCIDTSVTPQTHVEAMKLIDRFLNLRVAPLLMSAVSWSGKPAKEITESYATLKAVLAHAEERGFDRAAARVSVLVVGDGTSPRTAALVACLTGWTVTSIDPLLRVDGPHPEIRRLTCVRGRLEEHPELRADIVIGVHSHATPKATRAAVLPGGFLVVMPCCVPWAPADEARITVAKGVLSPARLLIVEDVS